MSDPEAIDDSSATKPFLTRSVSWSARYSLPPLLLVPRSSASSSDSSSSSSLSSPTTSPLTSIDASPLADHTATLAVSQRLAHMASPSHLSINTPSTATSGQRRYSASAATDALPSPCFVHSQIDSTLADYSRKDAEDVRRRQERKERNALRRREKGLDTPIQEADSAAPALHDMMSKVVASLNNQDDARTPRGQHLKLSPGLNSRRSNKVPSKTDESSTASPGQGSGSSDSASDGSMTEGDETEDDEGTNLTKRLAETAVSVREMSKQLGSSEISICCWRTLT